MDQVAMYSLVFASKDIVGFAIYAFRLARGQEVKVPGQKHSERISGKGKNQETDAEIIRAIAAQSPEKCHPIWFSSNRATHCRALNPKKGFRFISLADGN